LLLKKVKQKKMTRGIRSEHIAFILFSCTFLTALVLAVLTEKYFFVAAPFAFILFYLGWYHTEILFSLLICTLPFSFEYNFSASLGTDIPDELLMVLLAGLLVCRLACQSKSFLLNLIRHPIFNILLLSFCWLAITVIFSTVKLNSVKFMIAKSWYILPFVIGPVLLLKTKADLRRFGVILAGSILVAACIVLVRHSFSGFSFAAINDAAYPFFRNHVNYSSMLICSIPVLIACYGLSEQKVLKRFLALLLIISITALFFSYARGAWLAFLTGIITYGLIKRKLILQVYIASIIFLIAAVFWLKRNDRYLEFAHDYETTIFHPNFERHLIATYKLKDISTAERFYRWIAGVRMVKDSWLTGFGPSTFYNNYKEYTVPAFKTWVSDNKEQSTVHNYFLLVLIEQGLAGLLLFGILIGLMLRYCQKNYFNCSDPFYRTIYLTTGVILVMILNVNLLSDLIETDKVGSIFYLCAGILISLDFIRNKNLNPSPDIEGIS